jgi:hypothetical protein
MAKKEPSQPVYSMKVEGTDVMVPVCDGVRLSLRTTKTKRRENVTASIRQRKRRLAGKN